MSRTTLWRVLAVALPVLGALVAPLPAVDLAYQLRAGGQILDTGAIPAVDTWTFTASGVGWLDQQWGAQVLLALVYRLGGWTGLVLLRAILVGLAFGILLVVVRRRAPRLAAPASTLLVIAAFLVSVTALALRPQLFAIVLFAGTLLILAMRDAHPRAVWLVPVLALAWANLHGTFLLASAVCGLAWIEDLATMPASRGAARHRLLLVALVATVATLVTPFGPAAWGYVANLASNPTIAGRVSEWQPPSPFTVPGGAVWLSIVLAAALAAVRVRRTAAMAGGLRGAVPWPGVLALLVFGGFAAVSGRGTAWWPFVAVAVVAPWLERAPVRIPEAAPGGTRASAHPTSPLLRRLNLAIVALLALAGVALLPAWRPLGAAGVPEGTLGYAPQGLAAALASHASAPGRPAPRVWNPQAWGSWLELAVPGDLYALDSRIELFARSVWADADEIAAGQIDLLGRYQVDAVVTDSATDARLETALRDSGAWVPVAATCDGIVWLRKAAYPDAVIGPAAGCP